MLQKSEPVPSLYLKYKLRGQEWSRDNGSKNVSKKTVAAYLLHRNVITLESVAKKVITLVMLI